MIEETPVADCDQPITLAAVGDVLLHDAFQEWAAAQPEGYFAAMAPVEDLLKAADVTVANLEGPAARNLVGISGQEVSTPPTRYDGQAYRGYPLFNYHPSVVTDLKRLGVDVLQTANNHSLDRGGAGAERTLDAIEAAGLVSTGTRRARDRRTGFDWSARHTIARGGSEYTFAFLACTYGTNGVVDKHAQVLHCYDQREELLAQIRSLHRDPKIAAVVVLPHWGIEYEPLPEAKQVALAQDMADAGASAIIGTHPHVVQPEALLTARDGRQVPAVYSLGNFISRQIGLPRLSTVIYMLGFTPAGHGKLAATKTGWVPLRMQTEGTMRVDPLDRISGSEASPFLAHLLETFDPANRLAADPAAWWSGAAAVCPTGE
jgi:poly-gamma-glutamate synthesis protein (capsule biosynthesis protein)